MRRAVTILAIAWAGLAQAQEGARDPASRRTRVTLGPQLTPSFPGSDEVSLRPFIDVSRARGDETFTFEAPDESTGLALWQSGGFAVGPAIAFEGRRRRSDLGVSLPAVGFTVELGGFAQYQFAGPVRVRVEARQGIGGHKGLVGAVGADYVLRDADRWLVSFGPRLTLANGRHHRAYFGVSPEASVTSGLAAFRPDGGVQAVGATAGFLRQVSRRWGIVGFTRYDRLVADPGRSPITRGPGSRDQLSGGVALSYTFGG